MITQEQLKDIQERAEALHRYLDIDKKKIELEEEQLRTQAPDFWEDPKRAQAQMKKVKGIEKWIKGYEQVRQFADELALAFDFYHEQMVSEEEVDLRLRESCKSNRRPGTDEHAAPERGPDGLCAEDQLGCRWY